MNKKLFKISYLVLTLIIVFLGIKSLANINCSTTFLEETINIKYSSMFLESIGTFVIYTIIFVILYFVLMNALNKKLAHGKIYQVFWYALCNLILLGFIFTLIYTIVSDIHNGSMILSVPETIIMYVTLYFSPFLIIHTIRNIFKDKIPQDTKSYVLLFLTILLVIVGNIVCCIIKLNVPSIGIEQMDYYLSLPYIFVYEYIIYILMTIYLLLTIPKETKKKLIRKRKEVKE